MMRDVSFRIFKLSRGTRTGRVGSSSRRTNPSSRRIGPPSRMTPSLCTVCAAKTECGDTRISVYFPRRGYERHGACARACASDGDNSPVRCGRQTRVSRRCMLEFSANVRRGALRQLPPAAAPGARRHGRGVPGAAHRRRGLRAARRHQAHPAAPLRVRRVPRHVPRRGAARRAADAPEHRAHLRLRQGRRLLLHRHGVRRRRRPRAADPARQGAAGAVRAGGAHPGRRLRRAALRAQRGRSDRPQARRRAPRRDAAERARQLRRHGQAGRLRHRQGAVRGGAHAAGRGQGQVRVHVARAGRGQVARRAQRRLLGGHLPLRDAHRRAAVPARRRDRVDARDPRRQADPSREASAATCPRS